MLNLTKHELSTDYNQSTESTGETNPLSRKSEGFFLFCFLKKSLGARSDYWLIGSHVLYMYHDIWVMTFWPLDHLISNGWGETHKMSQSGQNIYVCQNIIVNVK